MNYALDQLEERVSRERLPRAQIRFQQKIVAERAELSFRGTQRRKLLKSLIAGAPSADLRTSQAQLPPVAGPQSGDGRRPTEKSSSPRDQKRSFGHPARTCKEARNGFGGANSELVT